MADMESSGAGATKRKHKENAFTAKAESGTLKVKIMRRDQRPIGDNATSSPTAAKTRTRRSSKHPQAAPSSPPSSPPKPRPNRKHVPIFYEEQFRQPIKRGTSSHSHSSSTDESAAQSTSSTGVPSIYSTSTNGTEVAAAASTSSSTSSFVAQLSDVRLQSASTSGGDLGPPPRTNPLFARNESDGLGTLGELLRPYFPSGSSGLQPSFPLGGAQPTGTTSSAGLLADQTAGLSSALHQLASSSASYRSALDALSKAAHVPSTSSSIEVPPTTGSTTAQESSSVAATSSTTSKGGLENYRFDPFTALQTAIDHARRAPSTNASNDKQREIGSPNSSARFYRLEPSGSSGTTGSNGNTTSLDPPPELPPAFTLQNSLMGGGIQRSIPSEISVGMDKNATSSSPNSESTGKDVVAALGPPPDTPPSFLLQNSLTGGGISILDLPRSHPSLDKLGSLTRLISQANETAEKDLNATLGTSPKTHLSLDRLVSLTSVTSEDGEEAKEGMNLTVSRSAASATDTSSASPSTTHETEGSSSEAIDLGPPPSGPPAFTIGNSLMGGGIELQPPVTNVNTHNFDWKLHRSASSSGGNATSSPAATGTMGIGHGLRARLERTLASSHNDTDKS